MMLRALTILLALAGLIAAQCQTPPVPPPPTPVAYGGVPVPGGSGGVISFGGLSEPWSAGGTPVVAQWPHECDGPRRGQMMRPSLSGWHKDVERAKKRRARPSYQIVSPSVFRAPNLELALDQGALGSCTGNAIAQCLSTSPFKRRLTEFDAIRIYSRATEVDPFKGVYPPTDTGSNGSSAWQAANDLGYYTGQSVPIESLEELQGALQKVSVPLGVDWWSGMFTPTASGELQMTGTIEGGHEILVTGWNAELKIFWIRNSWGSWGLCRGPETGYAYLSAGTLQKLLNAGGELDAPTSDE